MRLTNAVRSAQGPPRGRTECWRWRAPALLPLVATATLQAACARDETGVADGVTVQLAAAEVRPMRITAEADGELEPVLRVEVKSKASGEILELFVDSGDEVEEGTILAKVDPRDVQNGHDQARADLDVAEARIKNARAQLERNRQLLEREVITTQAFEVTELEYANAQAALVRATTNLELAQLRLTDVTIRAPLDGTILEKHVEYGQVIQSATQNVSGGTTLFVMANLDDMRVRMLVDEVDVGKLAAGLEATVTVEAFRDRTFSGEIEKIEPQALVQQNVTMFPVIVRLDNRAGLLKPGMNAGVEVLIDERGETLAVPSNAVVQAQEVAAAAEVLGLDPEAFAIDYGAWGPLMQDAARRARELAGDGEPDPPTKGEDGGQREGADNDSTEAGGAQDAADAPSAPFDRSEIRAKIQSGEISMDSARALFRAMGGPGGRGGGRPGSQVVAATGASTGDPAYRPAVGFVVDSAGTIDVRPLVIGLSDWDYVEILAGVQVGEDLALVGPAQLQARQQERIRRIQQRMRPF
ncbi:MAG: efflux RND transporter periplasmic adaptor subunit [Gemmatimonadetes bacterium]|nr:efflux RND transporter periplasmic adaptor subunit [Gemmatimonadota bacterium]